MRKLTNNLLLAGAVCFALCAAGCGKSSDSADTTAAGGSEEQAVSASSSSLPEAPEVMAALDKQDYDAVVAGLVKARQNVTTPEQDTQFANLADDVKIRLLEDAPTNPKANEALGALRALTGGR